MGLAMTLAAAALALGGVAHARPHPVVFGTAASNQRLAEKQATRELRSVPVPPGARRVTEAPSPALEEPLGTSGDPNEVDRWKWFVAPGTVTRALAWFEAHPPRRAHIGATYNSRGSAGAASSILFEVAEHSRRVSGPGVFVSVAKISGGRIGILVEVRQDWKTPHPAAAKVPAEARIIDVSRETGRGTRWQEIRKPSRVRRISHVIDQLPLSQPEINYGCGLPPSTGNHIRVRILFKARRGGPVLAEATQRVPLAACESMMFTVRGDPHTYAFDEGTRAIELLRR
jgi:hypothetical protein